MRVRRVARAMRGLGVAAGVAALALLVPGVSHAHPGGDRPGDVSGDLSGEYVALGDSYVAGPLIPTQTGMPPGCQRSDQNYPSLVRAALRPSTFRDVSCSGATTRHMTAPQSVTGGKNPAQLNALSRNTKLVTLGIGGNDIGFGEIVRTCASMSPTQPLGAACRDHFHRNGSDELAERIENTAPKVERVLRSIKRLSPDAKVLLVGYPTILPDSGPGCFPAVPFSPGDVEYLRQTTRALNAMLADQAERTGVEFVDTQRSSVGHDICQPPGTKWVEGLIPTSPAAPVHPNAVGMRNSANQVLRALQVQLTSS